MNDTERELEEFKHLIDSRNLSSEERKREREAILKARAQRFQKRSEEEKTVAKLMQLKYLMEEYVEDTVCKSGSSFSTFLSTYVDILYPKRKQFAEDISVKPITLSHIIHKHREPRDSFFHRLILHSQETFKSICKFEEELWIKVYFQDKVCSLKNSSEEWAKSESKHVKGRTINV